MGQKKENETRDLEEALEYDMIARDLSLRWRLGCKIRLIPACGENLLRSRN